MTAVSYQHVFTIAADHPALAGHFPGNPIVPGVVLLDQVTGALQLHGLHATGIVEARFRQVLKAGEQAQLGMEHQADQVRFRIEHDGCVIASGKLKVSP